MSEGEFAAALISELEARAWQGAEIGLFRVGGKGAPWYIRLRRGELTVERSMDSNEWPLLRMSAREYATMVVEDLLRRAEGGRE